MAPHVGLMPSGDILCSFATPTLDAQEAEPDYQDSANTNEQTFHRASVRRSAFPTNLLPCQVAFGLRK